ncbi:MAG: hypothetical protein JWM11_8119 [Planctomycetaceae bacterium]|nr:hypothetical protein [Planctomycetaceae bacterium]
MSITINRSFGVIFCLTFAFASGCESKVFRSETRLFPDGSVERAISQPLENVPEAARNKDAGWQELFQTRLVNPIETRDVPIRELAKALRGDRREKAVVDPKLTNFVAWGKFANFGSLPDSFEVKVLDDYRTGRIVRSLDRVELGFVTEWRWKENLVDTFNLTEHRIAREEIIRDSVAIAIASARRAWGSSYDLHELENWLNTEARAAFHESCDLVLEMGFKRQLKQYRKYQIPFFTILQRHGLDLFESPDKPLTDEKQLQSRVEEFLVQTVDRLVKDKEGKPLMRSLVSDMLKTWNSDSSTKKQTRLQNACEHILSAQYGGQEKFERLSLERTARLVGCYLPSFMTTECFKTSEEFEYQLEMPGVIMKTTGQLFSNNQVRWRFPLHDAFPLGYSMEATAVVVNEEAVRKYLPAGTLQSQDQVNRYLDLVRKDQGLALVLIQFANHGDPSGYDLWVKNCLESGSVESIRLANDIKKLSGR